MNHGRQEFHVITGGRPAAAHPLRRPAAGQPPRHTANAGAYAGPQDLSDSLSVSFVSMEQRLSQLLEDRERMGRDLHDSVLQSLYAIGLSLETAGKISPPLPPDATRARTHAIEQLNRLIHDVRGTIHRLKDGTIQSFDLAEELANLQRTYEQIGGMTITLDLQPGAMDLLTMEEEQDILHIVREALSNCVRHAQATQASISLRLRGTRLRLTIRDNGIGFSHATGSCKGYGLTNMEARAKKLGGTLRIKSKPGEGSRLTAELLLEPVLTSL